MAKLVRHRRGIVVAFLGADGSGKSTVITALQAELAPTFSDIKYIHLRPTVRTARAQEPPATDPHGQAPRSYLGSVAKMIYLLLAYIAGWYVNVLPHLHRSELVIFDRYFHDTLVDPVRYRYAGPLWLVRLVGKLIPKPNLWILLDADPDILQSRKQEVSPQETSRQRNAYLALAQELPDFHIVDASRSPDEVAADAEVIILDNWH